MKSVITLVLLLLCCTILHAQSTYNRAIGIKIPGGFSVSYKQFVADTKNVEAQATIWNKGFRVSGLYEFNYYSFNTAGLSWFVGPGAHIGFWKEDSPTPKNENSKIDIGIDGIIGLDYKIKNAPLNISLDWQPAITLVGTAGFTPAYGGVGIRYTF